MKTSIILVVLDGTHCVCLASQDPSLSEKSVFVWSVFYFICKIVLPARMSVHRMHDWCWWQSEEGIRCTGTGVTDGGLPTMWVLELNSGPQQEQQVLLTAASFLCAPMKTVKKPGLTT